MYNEASESHMLCAVQVEEYRFLISNDASFPDNLAAGSVDASSALAEMWYDARAKRYRLTSTSSCENCDERLGKYTCGVASKHGGRHRQHLLDVFQVGGDASSSLPPPPLHTQHTRTHTHARTRTHTHARTRTHARTFVWDVWDYDRRNCLRCRLLAIVCLTCGCPAGWCLARRTQRSRSTSSASPASRCVS